MTIATINPILANAQIAEALAVVTLGTDEFSWADDQPKAASTESLYPGVTDQHLALLSVIAAPKPTPNLIAAHRPVPTPPKRVQKKFTPRPHLTQKIGDLFPALATR